MSENKRNRTLIIIGVVLGIAGLAFLVWLLSLLLTAPSTVNETGTSTSEEVVKETELEFLDTKIDYDPEQAGHGLITAEVTPLPENQYGEWQVKNADKEVIAEGNIEEGGKIAAPQLPLTEENNTFTVEIRVLKELGGKYTEWLASEPLELASTSSPDDEGVNTTAEPRPEYYDTAWAKGEGSEQNLREALQAAWGATQVSYEEDACSQPLNSATIVPGEIFPPGITDKPRTGPDGVPVFLKYDLAFYSETGASVAFYWCQNLEDIQQF